jgi:hypothetical protein
MNFIRWDVNRFMSDGDFLPQIARHKFEASEAIGHTGKTLADFWSWYSNLYENIQRGIFAEYLVAAALDVTEAPRDGWAGYDLDYGHNKIEVKSSAYLQAWKSRVLSKPAFAIAPREQWDVELQKTSDPLYASDVFVFCLFNEQDANAANILDTHQWRFYVVATSVIRRYYGKSKQIKKLALDNLTRSVGYEDLHRHLDEVLENPDIYISPPIARVEPPEGETVLYTYAVARRGTRENPVIVTASDYLGAFEKARRANVIASFGNNISSIRLTGAALNKLLESGAMDLR